MISLISGCAVQFPAMANLVMPAESPGMVMHLFGAMAVFLGVMLVFSARNLRTRGALVAWEGVLRLFGCAIMIYFGAFGGAGANAVAGGLFDGMVGLAYLVGLPKHLGVPLADILLDRQEAPSSKEGA